MKPAGISNADINIYAKHRKLMAKISLTYGICANGATDHLVHTINDATTRTSEELLIMYASLQSESKNWL